MQTTNRQLKIEEVGDRWTGMKPKIRIMGKWLDRAGFKPGHRVQIHCISPGLIEMRLIGESSILQK